RRACCSVRRTRHARGQVVRRPPAVGRPIAPPPNMDLSRYAELFLTESREHLSAMNHALLALESTPTAGEPVGAIFRAVHTVKGMSATMGYRAVTDLAHEMESVLDRVRRGELAV